MGGQKVAASMNENNLVLTESSAGKLVKRMGSRERDSMAGRERLVCG